MLTQCPYCHTTFRVTREILRVADGQVRCGRCQTQFDAIEQLIEEFVEESEAAGPEASRFEAPAHAPQDAPRPDPGCSDEPSGEQESPPASSDAQDTSATVHAEQETGTQQDVVEEWIEFDVAAAPAPAPAPAPADQDLAADSTRHANDAHAQDFDADETSLAAPLYTAPFIARRSASAPSSLQDSGADEFELPQPARRSPVRALFGIVLALMLALLLAAQITHHYRSTLARHPSIGAPLMRAYDALGMQLTPEWNLHAYELRQWGVVSDPTQPGTLKVRASITNLAPFAQPYPQLRLVLEDRRGELLRAREFQPAEYLDPAVAFGRLLGPSQKANAAIAIVDPGPDAEGFRFDVCLPGKNATVCAADAPMR